jgi:hypothetical protein
MVGKLKKRTTNGPNLIPFRLCAFPAGNLALADQKPIINDDVNPTIRPLAALAGFSQYLQLGRKGHGKAGRAAFARPQWSLFLLGLPALHHLSH